MLEPKWKRFEMLVADIQKDLAPDGFKVTPNDKILGKDSEVLRQIDVSMRGSVGQFELLMVMDAKDYKEPVDVKVLEEFIGLVQDVRAQKAGIVSAKGFSKAAVTKAAKVGIDLFSVIDSGEHEWKTLISLPAACEVTELTGFQVEFSGVPFEPFSLSMDAVMNPRQVELFTKDGIKLGTIDQCLEKIWWSGEIEFGAGVHRNLELVGNPVYIEDAEVEGGFCATNLTAHLHVKKRFFHGEVPLKEVRGLRNEINGRTSIVKNMKTEAIEFQTIQQNWQQVSSLEELAVSPILLMRVIGIA